MAGYARQAQLTVQSLARMVRVAVHTEKWRIPCARFSPRVPRCCSHSRPPAASPTQLDVVDKDSVGRHRHRIDRSIFRQPGLHRHSRHARRHDRQLRLGSGAPVSGFGVDTFSVRWTGEVVPQFSETYRFYTSSDDGVRLWVNNQQIVNNWTDHGTTENSGTIALTAGQRLPDPDGVLRSGRAGGGPALVVEPEPAETDHPAVTAVVDADARRPPPPRTGLYIDGRFLKDPCGQTITIRGYEQPVGRGLLEADAGIPEMARTGANYARLLVQIPPHATSVPSVNTLQTYIDLARANGMLVELSLNDGSGGDAVYNRQDVKNVLFGDEDVVIIHGIGESQQSTDDGWVNEAKNRITRMRGYGYKHVIFAGSREFGRNPHTVLNRGAEVLAADPLRNVHFLVQLYWGDNNSGANYYESRYGLTVEQALDRFAASNLAIQAGLLSDDSCCSSYPWIDFESAMTRAQQAGSAGYGGTGTTRSTAPATTSPPTAASGAGSRSPATPTSRTTDRRSR